MSTREQDGLRGERPDAARPARPVTALDLVPAPLRTIVDDVGQLGQLLVRVVYSAVRHPRGYWGDVRDDLVDCLKRSFPALVAVTFGYGLLASTFAVSILTFLGAPNRLGTIYLTFAVREIAPFITAVVVSGVLATKTTSDFGARKIREELDAMLVLGQDPVRLLVLPRVISIVIITVSLNMISVVLQVAQALYLTVSIGNASAGSFVGSFLGNITVYELIGNLGKTFLFGLFIGVVSAGRGLAAKLGPEGVGRAVNQAVVVCIIATMLINSLFDVILLSYFPEIMVVR